ncbi:hypothetical protein SLEP1_g54093 [Rubroshorea leprosula]|uniref:DUF4228 domain protein n=1 Tax=Rubroshorea leprosula TaxID=152421 RepID=A0AAV5MCA3_9ROSI|nr:hypothetical protein SLEP1_g54093 [Rubroshorea leprosula]
MSKLIMGMKLLNLQMIPWCFQLLGNHISCLQFQPEPPLATIKLVKSDGMVKIYNRPIHVSELMAEFPRHMVCRSDSLYIGQKIPALSEDDQLQLGHNYFLLPKHFFQSVLSFVTVASLAKQSRNSFLKKAVACQPLDIQKTPSGCPRIRVSDEFITQLIEEGRMKAEDDNKEAEEQCSAFRNRVCNTPQLQKDYTQLVVSRCHWKPKLETIKETEKRKISSFGMKRRKKSQSQRPSIFSDHLGKYSCTKHKIIRIKSSSKR